MTGAIKYHLVLNVGMSFVWYSYLYKRRKQYFDAAIPSDPAVGVSLPNSRENFKLFMVKKSDFITRKLKILAETLL